MAISTDTLNKETDARFWAQTAYKPGQKLDPRNPTDKAMEPVWQDIYRKVKSEADGGKLVTTFDHPEVAQHLSDAAVASSAAGVHANAAATAPDAATSQVHVVAATTAQQISTLKARDAASKQPPTVSPTLVKDASKEVAKNPPPPQAPAHEHIAHEHVHKRAHRHAHDVHAQDQAQKEALAALYRETSERFWATTHYKPGQKLDMTIPQDAEMAKVWLAIFHQVQSAADATAQEPGNAPLPPAPPVEPPPPPQATSIPSAPPPSSIPPAPPPSQVTPMPPGMPGMPGMPPLWAMPPHAQMPPMWGPPGAGPRSPSGAARSGPPQRHHRHHRRGEGPLPRAQPGEAPPAAPGTPDPSAGPSPDASPDSSDSPPGLPACGPSPDSISTDGGSASPMEDTKPSAPSSGLSGGTIALIVLGAAVGGTLLYVGVKHKGTSSPRSRTSAVSRLAERTEPSAGTFTPPSGAPRPSFPRGARP